MAENSLKNVTIQSKPFFLSQVKTLFLLGGVFSAFFILMVGLVFFDCTHSMDNAIFSLMRSNSSNPILDQTLQRIVFFRLFSIRVAFELVSGGVFKPLSQKLSAWGVVCVKRDLI